MFKKVSNWKARTGTKIVTFWLIFLALIIIWLLVLMPVLGLAQVFADKMPEILTSLLGSGGILGGLHSIRIAIENREKIKQEGSN